MSKLPASALRYTLLLVFGLCLSAGICRADLVWSPQTGWRIEGGIASGLTGTEGRNALDLMNKARTSEENGSYGSAASAYEKVGKKFANSVYAPEALYRAAKNRLLRKQYFKAFTDFQEVVGRYPNTRRFNEIIGEQYRIASALLDGARSRIFWGLIPGFKNRERAIEYFETLLANAPYSDYAPLALMNVAKGHQKMGNIEESIDALDRMINNYPQSILAPDAYLKLGQAHAKLVDGPYYDQASTRDAITYFEDFQILFPGDTNVATAERGLQDMKKTLAESKIKIGDFYFYKRSNYTAARVLYNEAITVYPDSDAAKQAKAKLVLVEAKAAGTPAGTPKKKRFWLF